MPLSEDEKRILKEIEDRLYETDPDFAREVTSYNVYKVAFRNLKWSGLAFVAGLVAMLLTLSTSFLLAFGGFLVMLGAALAFERNARRLGKAGINKVTQGRGGGRMWREAVSERRRRMGERLKRDERD